MNQFQCKLAYVVTGAMACNGRTWGSGGQRSRSMEAKFDLKTSFSTTWVPPSSPRQIMHIHQLKSQLIWPDITPYCSVACGTWEVSWSISPPLPASLQQPRTPDLFHTQTLHTIRLLRTHSVLQNTSTNSHRLVQWPPSSQTRVSWMPPLIFLLHFFRVYVSSRDRPNLFLSTLGFRSAIAMVCHIEGPNPNSNPNPTLNLTLWWPLAMVDLCYGGPVHHFGTSPSCTWAHSVQTCCALFPLSPWYCSAIPCWPAAAGGNLGVTQKAAILGLGLGQTGHPEGTTDYHRRPCILCRRSSRLEQFVVIDAECTFVACF